MPSIFDSREIDAICDRYLDTADAEAVEGIGFAEWLLDAIKEKLRTEGAVFWVPDFGTFRREAGNKVSFVPEGPGWI